MLAYWIWLASRKGLGNKQKLELAARFGDVRRLWEAADYSTHEIGASGLRSLGDKDLSAAQLVLAQCRNAGISLLCAGDEAYPKRLLSLADPPLVLYYKGILPDFDREAAVAVVGTRRASAYGLMAAERISRQIARHGGLVISGMAAGIDAQAGWGAVHAEGCPVAVLGCGVDIVYPAENRPLYEEILRYGCVMSEYPPGTRPVSWNFPQRNRIVSGLSVAVLAVEAPEKSGTMITARMALEQGKDLFVVPGHIDSEFCVGSNALLRDGARVATSGWDILREYEAQFPDKLHKTVQEQPVRQTAAPVAEQTPAPKPVNFSGVTADEQKLLEPLLSGERTVDDLIAASGLTPQKALAMLTMLELKGMVTTLPGRRVSLS